jgi:hypothetical protein
MSQQRELTREQAADACACHVDTIRRYERAGKLPNRRQDEGGKWHLPVTDLVAAGLLDPVASHDALPEIAERSKAQRDVAELRLRLAASEARAEILEDQVAFLRQLATSRTAA